MGGRPVHAGVQPVLRRGDQLVRLRRLAFIYPERWPLAIGRRRPQAGVRSFEAAADALAHDSRTAKSGARMIRPRLRRIVVISTMSLLWLSGAAAAQPADPGATAMKAREAMEKQR